MIFIGYLPSSKGYYFWDPKGHIIVESCDVVFDKSHFPTPKDLPQEKALSPKAVIGLDSTSPSEQEDSENQCNRRVTRSSKPKTPKRPIDYSGASLPYHEEDLSVMSLE